MNSPARWPPNVSDASHETDSRQGACGRAIWRAAGVGLTSLGTPLGLGIADPLLGQATAAAELAVMFAIIGTALFGSQALSERAFRLLRWIGNRPEHPGPTVPSPPRHARDAVGNGDRTANGSSGNRAGHL